MSAVISIQWNLYKHNSSQYIYSKVLKALFSIRLDCNCICVRTSGRSVLRFSVHTLINGIRRRLSCGCLAFFVLLVSVQPHG